MRPSTKNTGRAQREARAPKPVYSGPMGLLDGKRALVTGASRGLGRAYALALAREGARVVVNGTTPELVGEVVAEIRETGGEAIGHASSVASFEGAGQIVRATIDAFGGL